MVSNPFCAPCAKTHELLDNWLKQRDDIKLKIIFSTANHDNDQKTKVAKHVAALTLLKDAQLVENALNDWYKQNSKNYDAWAAKYPANFNEEVNNATQKQKTWCDMAEIAFTPTILVNGHKLPEPYRLDDIKYLLT
jgi:protein-disulfide isomerase